MQQIRDDRGEERQIDARLRGWQEVDPSKLELNTRALARLPEFRVVFVSKGGFWLARAKCNYGKGAIYHLAQFPHADMRQAVVGLGEKVRELGTYISFRESAENWRGYWDHDLEDWVISLRDEVPENEEAWHGMRAPFMKPGYYAPIGLPGPGQLSLD